MDDLRWVLLLVGAVVVVAIYLSGRFESEDWVRERKQFRDGKAKKSTQKKRSKKTSVNASSTVAHAAVKQEPSISSLAEPETESKTESVVEPVIDTPVAIEPVSEVVAEQGTEVSTQQDDVGAQQEVETPPVEDVVPEPKPEEREKPRDVADAPEPVETTGEETSPDPVDENIEPGIEDEIIDVEIPVDLAMAEAQIQIAETSPDEESVQAEMPLEIEPLVLSVSILADEAEGFSGLELKEALEAEGLAYGAMRIFHFYDPGKEDIVDSDDAVFSAANLLEPGFFDLEKLADVRTPGVMLFCQLPGPLEGEAALELMLDKGRGLAVRLHGQMCDDKRNRFTAQAKTLYSDRIAAFNRELMLARKKNTQ